MREQLREREKIEVSLCGDLSLEEMERLVVKYIGSLSGDDNRIREPNTDSFSPPPVPPSLSLSMLGREKQLSVHLTDSDNRAMGYVAGPAPNAWGYFADGETISQKLLSLSLSSSSSSSTAASSLSSSLSAFKNLLGGGSAEKEREREREVQRRSHPLFGAVSQLLVQEVSLIVSMFECDLS
jgi:hypothetical protein